jgi:hypothetical protein
MSELMKQIEEKFGHVAFVDVEFNSLEDAYLNIAKEEERLLSELHNKHENRHSNNLQNTQPKNHQKYSLEKQEALFSDELKTFRECKANSTFWSQFVTTFKRRIIQFKNKRQELVANMQPLWIPIIVILSNKSITDAIFKTFAKSIPKEAMEK